MSLAKEFKRAATMPHDGCSLPEPGKDKVPIIEHEGHIRVKPRIGTSPDHPQNFAEYKRFVNDLMRMVKNGKMEQDEADRLIKSLSSSN